MTDEKEKRQHSRKGFSSTENDFSFYLEDKGQLFEINNIRDVSISGIGISIPKSFNIGHKVALKYDSADYHLTIQGTVAWSDNAANADARRLGVEFDTGNQEDNTLFFLAVRKYLDPFDNIPLKEIN